MPGRDNEGRSGSDTTDDVVTGFIEPIEIQEEMERSFLEYSMSVIVSRALPDVRDGLKPVHRRILYSMYDQRLLPDRPHTKCAKVVGDVMGSYHPHGDSAIYEALARMVQDFSMRHPLIDGHGNFGGTGPDEGPAAMRYTECRLGSLALELMNGIDQETVDFVANYDATSEEPTVLPARFPNMLVNGSQGIAVGMATNIPPHNLGEVIDATTHLLEHPDATPDDLMAFIKGPDFPTGALILGRQGILDALRTGRGSIKLRAVAEIEEGRDGATRIVVTEMPYQTSIASVSKKHRGPGPGGRPRRHRRGPGRLVGRQDPPGHPAEARCQRQRGPEQPVQADPDADHLQRERGGPGRRGAAHVERGPDAHPLRGPPGRGGHPAVRVPAGQGPGPGPRGRGTAQGHRHAGPGHRHHPWLRRPPGRARGAVRHALRLLGGAGQPHPGHDPGPPHPPRPDEPRGGAGQAARGDRRARVDPERPGQAAQRHRRRARGDPREVRQRAPDGHHPRPGRHERRGPGRGRGARRHHEPGRLREGRVGRRVPHPGPWRPWRAGGEAEGGGPDRRRGAHVGPRPPPAVLQPGPGLPAARPRDPDEGAHGPGDGHRQPAAAGPERDASRPSSAPATSRPTASWSSPPSWVRSRRRRSASTTSRAARASSPSTSATATSSSGWSRPTATTTCSSSPPRG